MSDDSFDLGDEYDEDEEQEQPAVQDNSVIRNLRKQLRQAQKDLKAKDTELETAKSYKERYLAAQLPTLFEEAGVENPKFFAKFAARDLGDEEPTVEWVRTWASANEAPRNEPQPQQEAAEEPQEQTTGMFAPTVGGEPTGVKKIPRAEVDAKLKTGELSMAQVSELISKGRIEYSNPSVTQRS